MRGAPPDHVGVDLIRAAERWEAGFNARMVAAGYPCFAEARSRLLRHIGPSGLAQARLVAVSGMTKQAVQKHIVALEADGLVRREDVASDGRARRIVFTEAGQAMLAAGDAVKREIEAEFEGEIGRAAFVALKQALKALGGDRQLR